MQSHLASAPAEQLLDSFCAVVRPRRGWAVCDSSLFLVCVFLNASLRFFSVVVVVVVVVVSFCLCELVGFYFVVPLLI